ncbi:aegerolysin family [Echria macrotheca]|uniref:Aegerolysin family n=1 Tax=Echria macrotheca TaxID=438768 RepID=A0AAJ0B8X5_9PEZI|nr:aegerolysin family [Echria macrotheca]
MVCISFSKFGLALAIALNMASAAHAAYAQWVHMSIKYSDAGDGSINVQNAHLDWGKFYEWDNKDHEISPTEVDSVVIGPGETGDVAACGRSDAASGTEGHVDLYYGNTKICELYWDCPWGSKKNTFSVKEVNEKWTVSATGASLNSGALGTVEVKVSRF